MIDDASSDHLPPKQFYAPSLRASLNLSQLVTLPAHGECNKSFESDEEYFTWSLAPLAMGSTAGSALVTHHAGKFRGGRSQGLGRTVLREFEKQPSGLHLPPGLIIKRVQGERISRVVWKLTRGLYFHEASSVLTEDTPRTIEFVEPERARETAGRNAVWEAVKAHSPRGSYGGVFEYKYLVGDAEPGRLHCWGMLLWDKVMIFVAHHDPVVANRESAEAV